jgi:hypothetical protein
MQHRSALGDKLHLLDTLELLVPLAAHLLDALGR